MKEETAMDKITADMMEHICDKLCRFPYQIAQEQLDEVCDDCKMGQYVCNILNEYNDLTGELKRAHKNALEIAGELLREKDKYQWIPVEDRLPEQCTSVLTVDSDGDIDVDFLESPGAWFWEKEDYCKPIAWMPLPERYRHPVLSEAGKPAGDYADNPTLTPAT